MVGSRHGRRGGAMMPSYNLARMSGMLDLSRDEKAKHFLPRWLRDAQYQCRAEMIVTMSTSCQSRRFAIRDSGMGAMLRPRRRAMDRAAVGNVKMWNCGSVKVWKYENGLGLRQIPPRVARRARGSRTGT